MHYLYAVCLQYIIHHSSPQLPILCTWYMITFHRPFSYAYQLDDPLPYPARFNSVMYRFFLSHLCPRNLIWS